MIAAEGPLRIAIVEDHALVRGSLRELVQRTDGLEVVCEAGDAERARPRLRGAEPDVVLLDIGLPGESGLDLARWINDELPGTDVVFLSMHDDYLTLKEAMALNPAGFVPKNATTDELMGALEVVAAGGSYISPQLASRVINLAAGTTQGRVSELTDREVDVLRLLASGHRQTVIAERLFVTVKTVKNHLTSIYGKLGVDRASQAVAEAYRLGIIHPGEDV